MKKKKNTSTNIEDVEKNIEPDIEDVEKNTGDKPDVVENDKETGIEIEDEESEEDNSSEDEQQNYIDELYKECKKLSVSNLVLTIIAVITISVVGLLIGIIFHDKYEKLQLQQKIENQQVELKIKDNTIADLDSQLKISDSKLSDAETKVLRYRNVYEFCNEYVVVVTKGETVYHKYGCQLFEGGIGLICSRETAELMNYEPCEQCCKEEEPDMEDIMEDSFVEDTAEAASEDESEDSTEEIETSENGIE